MDGSIREVQARWYYLLSGAGPAEYMRIFLRPVCGLVGDMRPFRNN